MAAGPQRAPVAGVAGFDRVGRTDHPADLGVTVKKQGELGPGVAPEPADRRVTHLASNSPNRLQAAASVAAV